MCVWEEGKIDGVCVGGKEQGVERKVGKERDETYLG